MNLDEFYKAMEEQQYIVAGEKLSLQFHKLAQEAMKITSEINGKYHTPKKLRKLFSKLIGKKVDDTFVLFPPFYTDCGKNINIGKNVFINSCCHFQDQGGITIGDGCLIGHNVTIATLNHDFDPSKRANITPKSVKIGKNVWIGSDSTILPGIEIGDGAVIGAGSVVTKSVLPNTIVAGCPAKLLREIKI